MPQSKVTNIAMKYLATNILPSSAQVGKIAAQAGVKRMVLTHLSATINRDKFAEILADIRQDYEGDVLLGEDLMVLKL
jgi:ribonuclease Z